jgi:hypothetical protein
MVRRVLRVDEHARARAGSLPHARGVGGDAVDHVARVPADEQRASRESRAEVGDGVDPQGDDLHPGPRNARGVAVLGLA